MPYKDKKTRAIAYRKNREHILQRQNKWRAKNKDRRNAKTREWRKTVSEERRDYYREWHRQYRQAHPEIIKACNDRMKKKYPEKIRARAILKYAVDIGVVIRPNYCSECGVECAPQGHHPDYSAPLEVIWLCDPCHKKVHRSEKSYEKICATAGSTVKNTCPPTVPTASS
jgi:hypothetical protein